MKKGCLRRDTKIEEPYSEGIPNEFNLQEGKKGPKPKGMVIREKR